MAKLPASKKERGTQQRIRTARTAQIPNARCKSRPDASARAAQMEHQGKLSAADKKKIDAKADKVLAK